MDSPIGSPEVRRPITPRWLWSMLLLGIAIGLAVRRTLDHASGNVILAATMLLCLLIGLIRFARFNTKRGWGRYLPLAATLATLVALVTLVRIDSMSGNLVPQRVSWRWTPPPDARLDRPAAETIPRGIDLATTTPDDFPQFLGPGRDAALESPRLAENWQQSPPELVWRKETFGAGWSAFSVVNGFAVTMEQLGPEERITCYEVPTGKLCWVHAIETRHETVPGGVGPRSTPTIYQGRVYALGGTGILRVLDGASGELVWQVNLLEETGITPAEDLALVSWGRAASPLVDGDRVIVPLGGKPNSASNTLDSSPFSLAAYDLAGNRLWRQGDHQVSYSSPLIAEIDGVRQLLIVCEDFLSGHAADTGEKLWDYSWPGKSHANANCSQPIVVDQHRIFLSKGYAYGASLIQVGRNAEGDWEAEQLWHKRQVMKTKFSNPVLYQGYVYGLDDTILSCIELETGRVMWRRRDNFGHGQVLRVGEHLLILAESGIVYQLRLDPQKARLVGEFAAIEGKTWNSICLSGAYLLVRNGEQAACFKLSTVD